MELTKAIFGKDTGITKQDLCATIEAGLIFEKETLEFKEVRSPVFGDNENNRKDLENLIISRIISMLNAATKGILLLGFQPNLANRKMAQKVVGVETINIKSEEQLRQLVVDNISALPQTGKLFSISIFSTKIEDNRFAYGIEVSSEDNRLMFSSKITCLSYYRIDDETRTLTHEEYFRHLSHRTYARIGIRFEMSEYAENTITYDIILTNSGYEPGKYVVCLLEIKYDSEIFEIVLAGSSISKLKGITEEKQFSQGWQLVAGYPPSTLFIYPGLQHSLGKMIVKIKQKEFPGLIATIKASCHEERGVFHQMFNLHYVHLEETDKGELGFPEETYSRYKAYIFK